MKRSLQQRNISVNSRGSANKKKKSLGEIVQSRKRSVYGNVVDESRDLSSAFTEHHLTCDELCKRYPQSGIDSDNPRLSQGLSLEEADERFLKFGPNKLPPPHQISDLMLFLRQFLNILWLLLLFAAIISLVGFIVYPDQWDFIIVFAVLIIMIFVMCCGSFMQERKAREVVKGFAGLLPAACSVIREGCEQQVPAEELVVGDIVIIKNGARVAADARVLHSSGLKLETSSITGEPEPIEFHADAAEQHVTVFESQNVAFNGSFCVDGEAVGLVIRTGQNTVIGQIAALTTGQSPGKSSLELEILHFVKFLVVVSLVMATAVFLVGSIINHWQNEMHYIIYGFLTIIIANVPNGLPATVTSQLTIITRRLASMNVFLKRLDIVETFGATTVVASDKTGTLTMNKMTVTDLWNDMKTIEGFAKPIVVGGNRTRELSTLFASPLDEMLTVMCVCNKAQFEDEELRKKSTKSRKYTVASINGVVAKPSIVYSRSISTYDRQVSILNVESGIAEPVVLDRPILGSPSEAAMLRYGEYLFSVSALRSRFQLALEIPFNSKRKWHLQIYPIDGVKANDNDNNGTTSMYRLMMKGAPEILIKKCSTIATSDGNAPLDETNLAKFQNAYDNFGNNGRRVIGFVSTTFTAPTNTVFDAEAENFPTSGLNFLGMCAIMDPPRKETAGAIAKCKGAGIKVFMVTGDHPSTAAAIAREIGLIGPSDQPEEERDWDVCHGEAISTLTPWQWDALLSKKYLVFGRTTPEQKLLIVEECQKRNEVITMTGDGVNDAPALKRADIGVAMGITGSDVAKQAADIILMDDNFASIVKGIEQGRLLFDNLKKTLAYTLSHLWPEIYPVILNFAVGLPLGLTTLQILSIDLGTEIGPSVSFAYEEAENDIMMRPPRKRSHRLVSKGVLAYSYIWAGNMISICACAAYIFTFWWRGVDLRKLPYTTNTYWQAGAPPFESFGRYFNADEQLEILQQACAAWYIGTVLTQLLHVFSCRTRRTSIFQHGMRNLYTIGGVLISVVIMVIVVYVPGVQFVLGDRSPIRLAWVFPPAMAIVMLVFNEFRKLLIRNWPRALITRALKW